MIIAQRGYMVGFTLGRLDGFFDFLEPNEGLIGIFAFKYKFFISFINFDSMVRKKGTKKIKVYVQCSWVGQKKIEYWS